MRVWDSALKRTFLGCFYGTENKATKEMTKAKSHFYINILDTAKALVRLYSTKFIFYEEENNFSVRCSAYIEGELRLRLLLFFLDSVNELGRNFN